MVVHIDPTKYNRTCPRCQANVHGTDTERCPECGTPVERSYAPDLLENRSLEFLTSLSSGLRLVFFGLIGMICLAGLALVGGIFVSLATQGASAAYGLVVQILSLGLSLVVLLGWWRVTTPDPGRVGGGLDVRPRQIIRITVCVQLATNALELGLEPFANSNNLDPSNPVDMLYGVVGLVSLIAWAVQFFAAMLYIRWLARRIPDYKLESDARRFMWLGPVLYIPGSCLIVGPLIAFILYLIMLNTLRKHVTAMLLRLGAL